MFARRLVGLLAVVHGVFSEKRTGRGVGGGVLARGSRAALWLRSAAQMCKQRLPLNKTLFLLCLFLPYEHHPSRVIR